MIRKLLRRVSAGLLSGVMIASAAVSPVSAAVVDKENPNNYDNFAEALQLALCFYDANKCGDEVADDGYYTWRGNCHVKAAAKPTRTAARVTAAHLRQRVSMSAPT